MADELPPLIIHRSGSPPAAPPSAPAEPSTADNPIQAAPGAGPQGSRQWIRWWNLSVEGGGGAVINISELRIVFKIEQFTSQAPNRGAFRIYNLSETTMNKIMAEFKEVRFEAGYQDHHGLLFSGNVVQYRKGRENPVDTFLDLFCGDGDYGYNQAVTNKTLPAGSTPKTQLDEHMKEFKKYGIDLGFVGVDLNTPKYPRAVSFFGMTRDYVRQLARDKDGLWSIQNKKVQILDAKTVSLPGGPIILNSETGMIGMPVQTIQGIMVRCLVNTDIIPGTRIKINQKDIQQAQLDLSQPGAVQSGGAKELAMMPVIALDGLYSVLSIEKNGDTRGTPWYYDLTCIATNAPFPTGADHYYSGYQ